MSPISRRKNARPGVGTPPRKARPSEALDGSTFDELLEFFGEARRQPNAKSALSLPPPAPERQTTDFPVPALCDPHSKPLAERLFTSLNAEFPDGDTSKVPTRRARTQVGIGRKTK